MFGAVNNILNRAYENALHLEINKDSRIIFFSDLHKGDNSPADDFTHNRTLYDQAMLQYLKDDYIYIEVGDGIELWENTSFEPIYRAHKETFDILKSFSDKEQLYLLWGNHDMEFRDPIMVERLMFKYFTPKNIQDKKRLFNLKYQESLILNIEGTKNTIFVIHGHQADYMNYIHWKFHRFFVRYFWKYMQQWFGISDPTSPAENFRSLTKVERKINNWILKNENQMVICGHTHRPRFPDPGDLPQFNDGCGVHPDSITGIEITDLKISLIKWYKRTDEDGKTKITKTFLEGPVDIFKFL